MATDPQSDKLGKGLAPGSHHYRAFVGSPETYDIESATQFTLLTFLGLREDHFVLDIGCGSLKAGKLLIPYLLPGHYFGIEPEQWLIDEGIENELGRDIINMKAPVFSNDREFTCTVFGHKFDFILAHSIFTHASQAQISRCISQVKECMKPTSIFAATIAEGEENYTGSDWVYSTSTCVAYTLTRMQELALEHGLICKLIDWPHPWQQWVLIGYPENDSIRDVGSVAALGVSRLQLHSQLVDLQKKSVDWQIQLGDLQKKSVDWQIQLGDLKKQLSSLEGHPYVKFGMRIYAILRRIKSIIQTVPKLLPGFSLSIRNKPLGDPLPDTDLVGYESLLAWVEENNIHTLDGDVVEIGSFLGGGTAKLARFFGRHGKKVYTIDIFDLDFDNSRNLDGNAMSSLYRNVLESLGGRSQEDVFKEVTRKYSNIEVIKEDSKKAKLPCRRICFSFIDGCHDPDYVRSDFYLVWDKTVSGGVVGFHDYGGNLPQTTRVIDELIQANKDSIKQVSQIKEKWIILLKKM